MGRSRALLLADGIEEGFNQLICFGVADVFDVTEHQFQGLSDVAANLQEPLANFADHHLDVRECFRHLFTRLNLVLASSLGETRDVR